LTVRVERRFTLPRKAHGTALSATDAVQANIHAVSMPCLLKIASSRARQGSFTSLMMHALIAMDRVGRDQRQAVF